MATQVAEQELMRLHEALEAAESRSKVSLLMRISKREAAEERSRELRVSEQEENLTRELHSLKEEHHKITSVHRELTSRHTTLETRYSELVERYNVCVMLLVVDLCSP